MKGLLKVVTACEMNRIEQLALSAGSVASEFMENAGRGIARALFAYIKIHPHIHRFFVFVGKGNNGADAFTAAVYMKEAGMDVDVITTYDQQECSPLCQRQWKRYQDIGGLIRSLSALKQEELCSGTVILDGLVGTGFKGAARGTLYDAIQKINHSQSVVFAVDIPSGLCGTTGSVETEAVKARFTLFLELPKLGFFIGKGWGFVGTCLPVGFGMPEQWLTQAEVSALLVIEEAMIPLLPPMKRTRHKYESGYVLAVAGSASMSGAAVLSCLSALHSGAGIVRLYCDAVRENAIYGPPFEIIKEGFNLDKILHEMDRASSFLIGPGMGRSEQIGDRLQALLKSISIPCVLDADALFWLAEHPTWTLPMDAVLTPHHREMQRLLQIEKGATDDLDWFIACASYAKKHQTVVVVKGAPTMVFSHLEIPVIIPFGDPGMATAGSGDVLTGIIAALLAQKMSPLEAAILGVYLHGKAGEAAAQLHTSYSMVASNIIESLPDAFKTLLKGD